MSGVTQLAIGLQREVKGVLSVNCGGAISVFSANCRVPEGTTVLAGLHQSPPEGIASFRSVPYGTVDLCMHAVDIIAMTLLRYALRPCRRLSKLKPKAMAHEDVVVNARHAALQIGSMYPATALGPPQLRRG